MTLRELIVQCCGKYNGVQCSTRIGMLEIESEDEYCEYDVRKYFKSDKFQFDVYRCMFDYDENINKKLKSYLVLTKTNKVFGLLVKTKSNIE